MFLAKPIRLSHHARQQARLRGASEAEIRQAIRRGAREPAKQGRELCRWTVGFGHHWQGKLYGTKQVAPVIVELTDEIVVITVYTFYF